MKDFLQRYGQFNHRTDEYYFSNVRVGLIVGMVRPHSVKVACGFR